jgi:hypothetical protein
MILPLHVHYTYSMVNKPSMAIKFLYSGMVLVRTVWTVLVASDTVSEFVFSLRRKTTGADSRQRLAASSRAMVLSKLILILLKAE